MDKDTEQKVTDSSAPKTGKASGRKDDEKLSLGQHFADAVASTMGSWKFIITQSVLLVAWIGLNVTKVVTPWDPYPFILLNLALSFQAAYAAPFIMMSQNRQQEKDRKTTQNDYQIDVKAERKIELLHEEIKSLDRKIDFLLAALPPDRRNDIMAGAATVLPEGVSCGKDGHTDGKEALTTKAQSFPAAFIPVPEVQQPHI